MFVYRSDLYLIPKYRGEISTCIVQVHETWLTHHTQTWTSKETVNNSAFSSWKITLSPYLLLQCLGPLSSPALRFKHNNPALMFSSNPLGPRLSLICLCSAASKTLLTWLILQLSLPWRRNLPVWGKPGAKEKDLDLPCPPLESQTDPERQLPLAIFERGFLHDSHNMMSLTTNPDLLLHFQICFSKMLYTIEQNFFLNL